MPTRSSPPPTSTPAGTLDRAWSDGAYRALVESVLDYIFVVDRESRVLYANPGALRAEGRSLAELRGRRLDEVFPAEIAARQMANVARVLETGTPLGVRAPSCIGGRRLWLDTVLSPVREVGGRITAVVGLSRDVTAEVDACEAARASNERYQRILAATFDAILIHQDGIILEANEGAARLHGLASPAELVGRRLVDFCRPEVRPLLARRLQERPTDSWIGELFRADGGVVQVEATSTEFEAGGQRLRIAAARDVTDRHLLEQERQKAERIDSLGVLAGGIAHDFNNLLAGFLGHLEIVRRCAGACPDILEHVEAASRAVDRAKTLTEQLLSFARGGTPVARSTAIEGTLRDAVGFALRGSPVEGRVLVPPDLWPAEVDPGQLAQVLHNLVLNAAQAMAGGGRVEVRAGNEVLDTAAAGLQAGRYVRIDVEDHGPGIPPDVLPRIFDPYFTTRPGGTGLGLATTYGIVRNHRGRITVDTRLGQGTVFHVLLPASDTVEASPPHPPAGIARRPAHVLVMDDEPALREVLEVMLGLIGCSCEGADGGESALALYRQATERGRPFDVVVLDLTVPGGLGGVDTLAALRALDPGVRAIASSGYSSDPVLAQPGRYGFQAILAKPFRVEDIAASLERALGD